MSTRANKTLQCDVLALSEDETKRRRYPSRNTMEAPIISSISEFYDAVAKLRKVGVIRSDKYLGDLAEYICKHFYEVELAVSGRQIGYDGLDKEGKVQVKYHGSSTRTNIYLVNPSQYDNLLVVLGPGSLLRTTAHAAEFLIYRMSSATARKPSESRHRNVLLWQAAFCEATRQGTKFSSC